MKILMIVPRYNEKKSFKYTFPLGLAYVSSVLKKEYEVKVLNLNHYEEDDDFLINRELNKGFDLVATGGIALFYKEFEKIIKIIREFDSNIVILLGGQLVTCEPELVFENLKPDIAISGEVEDDILDIIRKGVKGIFYSSPTKDLDNLPYPDFEGFEFDKYLENMHPNDFYYNNDFDYPRVYPILGNRGCPFNCTFCWHESNFRQRSLDSIFKELEWAVEKYKINIILLYDDCFSVDKKRVIEFCDRVVKLKKKAGYDIKWSCQLTVQNMDEELLKKMKESGVNVISYGFESFSEDVLKSMKKPITPKMIENAFELTLKNKIGVQANFIFGDIAETKESCKITLDWWKEKGMGQIKLIFVQPYPNSDLYYSCLERGIIKDKLDFIKNDIRKSNAFNMTFKMSDEEIKELQKLLLVYTSKYCKRVLPMSKNIVKKNVFDFKAKCPFCNYINDYKNCYVDRATYGFSMHCRDCHKRFWIVSFAQLIGYRFYPLFRKLRDMQLNMRAKNG